MKTITSLLLLLASLTAQTPPTGAYVPVGAINQTQPYSSNGTPAAYAGEQIVQARVNPGDDAPSQSIGTRAVRIGRRLWWVTASLQVVPPAPATPVWHPVGASPAVVFGIASFQFTNYPLPGAAVGFDRVFMPAGVLILSPALVTQTTNPLTTGTSVPSGGYDLNWLFWDVPNDPALIGQVVGMQGARIEPFNGLWYLSDEQLVEIR